MIDIFLSFVNIKVLIDVSVLKGENMKYNARIEYTGNVERAGKLTLTREDGTVVLSKVPVAMPDEIFTVPQLFEKIHSSRSVQIKMDDDLRKYDKMGAYEDAYSEVIKNNAEGYFIKSIGKVLIKPTTDSKMKNDDHAFVMHTEHFDILFDILAKKNQLEIQTERVSFLWFPEKVINATGSINVTLANFENVESKVRNQKDDAERITALETAQKKARVNTGVTKPKLSDAINNIANIVNQESKKEASVERLDKNQPSNKTSVNNNTNSANNNPTRQSVIEALPTRTTYRDTDSLDALDVVLMYSNPELAPFIKPNSTLAWYLYFNNVMDKEYVENNIQNVQGFENVAASEFKYTPKGYSITLFDDKNQNNPVGYMEFDKQKNCYEVSSTSGEKTLLSIGENGQLQSCFKSSTGNETNMNLIHTHQGFLGNWESENNGVKVNSGISFNSEFGYNSTPNETVDLSRVQAAMVMGSIDNEYSSQVNSPFTFSDKTESTPSIEREYTPPPPPPKSDDVWSSSDPYSNGSSFRM